MIIFNPFQLVLSTHILEQNRKFYLICSASMGLSMPLGRPLLPNDFLAAMFRECPSGGMLDPGMPKPSGEWLLTGKFHAPGHRKTQGHEVKVRVGVQEKSLFVFGPRRWGPLAPTDPELIDTLPLEDRYAFGGPGFEANPAGMGHGDGRLPCLEDPRHLVASRGDRPEPAGFGPRAPTHPDRMKYQPHYGHSYREDFFPGYPEGLDWRYFQCAPEDQQAPTYFRGDESFELHHCHPEQPVIQGHLPGYRVRCFLKRKPALDEPIFSELPLNLDTVWFFPEPSMTLLIWRGGIEVSDDEASKVEQVLGAYEAGAHTRSFEHYRAALDRRLQGADPMQNLFNSEDLIAIGDPCAGDLMQEKSTPGTRESALARNLEAKVAPLRAQAEAQLEAAVQTTEAQLEAQGTSINLKAALSRPPQPDPTLQAFQESLDLALPGVREGGSSAFKLKDFSFAKLDQAMKAAEVLAQTKQAECLQSLAETRTSLIPSISEGLEGIPELPPGSLERIHAALEAGTPGQPMPMQPLPRVDLEACLAAMAPMPASITQGLQHLQGLQAAGEDPAAYQDLLQSLEKPLAAQQEAVNKELKQAQAAFREGYLLGAHAMPNGSSPHKEPLPDLRARFLRAVAAGEPVADGDWACLDLSGQNLEGVDLHGAFLEQVTLRGAKLRDANLSGAILARAELEDADFTGADLRGANLGCARASRACFDRANLDKAILSQGHFERARFRGSRLEGAQVLEICLDHADFTEAILPNSVFLSLRAVGVVFHGACLSRSCFFQGSLEDLDFTGADLRGCTWADMRLQGIRFDGAEMGAACFAGTQPGATTLSEVSFKGARLGKANFQNIRMPGADLGGAFLENAHFGGADLTGARLRGALAQNAQFRKAILTDADLEGIDLRMGSLAKAHLVQARFKGANLFTVDFLRCVLGRTDFKDCNLDRTILEGWRPE